ncbi:class I SAM-dependent methyltransferase [Xenophilus aerolatus]|nr:class I SAM-dependent methyltransferase [Xenophilus aerolatus]
MNATPASRLPSIGAHCLSIASFWRPQHLVWSAWVEHGAFAFWLINALRPRTVVELGTHNGYSFFAMCQAVKSLGLSTACYAVDTWRGDEHAGFYNDDIYASVSRVRNEEYSDVATLIRSTFDEALPYFPDGTIDLLHIDGRHGYEDVRHDFETWRPKLSSRAIVLFHDTNVRRDGFGVWKLWEELKAAHPNFEFVHGHGLGVMLAGNEMPQGIEPLFAASLDTDAQAMVRTAYSRLGRAASDSFDFGRDREALEGQLRVAQEAKSALEVVIVNERAAREAQVLECRANEARAADERGRAFEFQLASLEEANAALAAQLEESLRKLANQHKQLVRQRVLSEQQAHIKSQLQDDLQSRHPLAGWVDRWSRLHPRRARWTWRAMRVGHMILTFQFLRLARAALRRLR